MEGADAVSAKISPNSYLKLRNLFFFFSFHDDQFYLFILTFFFHCLHHLSNISFTYIQSSII